ncbi:MAG TPA: thioredoxin domain-containing protein, partial [Spirochaetota bacterium]
ISLLSELPFARKCSWEIIIPGNADYNNIDEFYFWELSKRIIGSFHILRLDNRMKKIIYLLLIVSVIGLTASVGLQVVPSILPGSNIIVSFPMLWGMPFAGYQLFLYLLLILSVPLSIHAGGIYRAWLAVIALPVAVAAIIVDGAVSGVMIFSHTFSSLIFIPVIIDGVLVLLSLRYYQLIKVNGEGCVTIVKSFFVSDGSPHHKASRTLIITFIVLLFYSSCMSSFLFQQKYSEYILKRQQIETAVASFYAAPVEKLDLYPTPLVMGNPNAKVTVIVFDDFLCKYCSEFYKTQQYLLSKYIGNIRFLYYHYPLDTSCNKYVKSNIHPNACMAAKAMIAAAQKGVFDRYLYLVFDQYQKTGDVTRDQALSLASTLVDKKEFNDIMNRKDTLDMIVRDIETAHKIGVTGTPTLFINGRRKVGVISIEAIDRIIAKEMKSAK